ncbi:hypothetical protein [Shimia sp.]|uniref:hypothetical protein n=1 Tax=Shimia sp. TaxID=1954381 RepID=UPI003BABBF2D
MTLAEIAVIALFPTAFIALVGVASARSGRTLIRKLQTEVRNLEKELLELQYDLGVKERPEFGDF